MENSNTVSLIFGLHPVLEAINSGKEIEKIFVNSGSRSPQMSEIVREAAYHKKKSSGRDCFCFAG